MRRPRNRARNGAPQSQSQLFELVEAHAPFARIVCTRSSAPSTVRNDAGVADTTAVGRNALRDGVANNVQHIKTRMRRCTLLEHCQFMVTMLPMVSMQFCRVSRDSQHERGVNARYEAAIGVTGSA